MSTPPLLRSARHRLLQTWLLGGLPIAIALGIAANRIAGTATAVVVLVVALLACVGVASWRARRLDTRWLVARLNEHARFEDSADLLFGAPQQLNGLQQRQRQRIEHRLQQTPPELRPRWPWRHLLACWSLALLLAAAALCWPPAPATPQPPRPAATAEARTQAPALREARLQVTPPAYAGQAVQEGDSLDARALQGSQLRWQLRFDAQPRRAWLQFHDGRRLPLQHQGQHWQASEVLQRPALYRIVTEPALADAGQAHRLQVVPDRPPQVKVLEPAQTLSQAAPRQRQWQLRFEASDDFGVAAAATLSVTTAKGSGENIDFKQHQLQLAGSGTATARRFAHVLDLAALGVGPGDEVVARLLVHDNRAPAPQQGQSPGLILRLPSERQVQASELEGAIKKVMPAYFRSQRQIILDAEALLKQRGTLGADAFTTRSDAIGVDQRILRLRYGQFLGEEAEGGAAAPTADLPTADADADADANSAQGDGSEHAHQHDAGAAPASSGFGQAGDVLAEYGHTHDHAEAATLLDPQTRATLKAALDQMWLSEGQLRQGQPAAALPYAYKALGFIKQVQQAERVYLARVGPELPPIDMNRRMSGKRDGLGNRRLQPGRATPPDSTAAEAWQALANPGGTLDLDALLRWLDAHPQALPDPLDVTAAVDELRQQPDCQPCRQRLRARLWPAVVPAPAPGARRPAADAMGKRYLDALPGPADMPR